MPSSSKISFRKTPGCRGRSPFLIAIKFFLMVVMVVGYFDFGCFTVDKPKAYSSLVINPDNPLPRPVT
jgi:hypothetical protein